MKCKDCPDGFLRPLMPAMLGTPWGCECGGCGRRCGHRTVVERLAAVEKDVKAALAGGGGGADTDALIKRLSAEELHPNHYFIFCLKENQLFAKYKVGGMLVSLLICRLLPKKELFKLVVLLENISVSSKNQ